MLVSLPNIFWISQDRKTSYVIVIVSPRNYNILSLMKISLFPRTLLKSMVFPLSNTEFHGVINSTTEFAKEIMVFPWPFPEELLPHSPHGRVAQGTELQQLELPEESGPARATHHTEASMSVNVDWKPLVASQWPFANQTTHTHTHIHIYIYYIYSHISIYIYTPTITMGWSYRNDECGKSM